jgi:hypothetical protein
MEHLDSKLREYAEAPFLAYLRDSGIDPRRRLAFAPHVAHFVLTFGDLCSLVLLEDQPHDRYQELVNANSREDQGHWRWFLTDLALLGQDPSMPFSDAIKVVWGDETVRTRRLSYHLCHMGLAADSIGRLVLVHCIEGAFKITVKDLAPAAKEFAALTGKPLRYLGGVHSDAESSHTLEDATVHRSIQEIELEPKVRRELCTMVDQAITLFSEFADEMLALAKSPTVWLAGEPADLIRKAS